MMYTIIIAATFGYGTIALEWRPTYQTLSQCNAAIVRDVLPRIVPETGAEVRFTCVKRTEA